jgi:predicted aconitase with swiveling domain
MKTLHGKGVFGGSARGKAIVTRMPMNFTAAFTKPLNLVPGREAQVQDRHHELFGKNLRASVLVYPATIGSTYTGMILLELMHKGQSPAAIIVQRADSLMVSGAVLAQTWFGEGIPVVEYTGDDIYDEIFDGAIVEVDGGSGEIIIR